MTEQSESQEPEMQSGNAKHSSRKRNKDLKIKMSETEYEYAKRKAKDAGYPLATYARNVILSKKIFDRTQTKINTQYLAQFAWIGNNLNQIAKVLNTQQSKNLTDQLNLIEVNLQLSHIQLELENLAKTITEHLERTEQ